MASDVKHPGWLPRALRPVPPTLKVARELIRRRLGENLSAAHRLPGYLHADEAAALCHLAEICPEGPIVEIGSFKGKSTVFMGTCMKPTNTLHAIDPHISVRIGSRQDRATARKAGTDDGPRETSWHAFNEVLAKWNLTERVNVIRARSHDARADWNETIAMLWIDGDHTYDAVRQDIDDWTPLVAPAGFAAFHDTKSKYGRDLAVDVRRAIMDSAMTVSGEFETYLELRNLWIFRRTAAPHSSSES